MHSSTVMVIRMVEEVMAIRMAEEVIVIHHILITVMSIF